MKPRIRPKGLMVIAAAIATGSLTFVIVAASSDGKSQLQEVPGPAVGPAGQTGELHYFEGTPATEYNGGAKEYGPYRLLPAGTKYIVRPFPEDKAPGAMTRTAGPSAVGASSLYIRPPDGFTLADGWVVAYDGFDHEASFTWTAPGATVWAAYAAVDDWRLPLDVYLYFNDSPLVVRPAMIGGYYAIVEEPRKGPAPNVGKVELYVNGRALVLRSPDLGQDRLEAIAAEVAKSIGGTR